MYHELEDIYGIDRTTVSKIIIEVSEAILTLEPELIKFPTTDECKENASKFFDVAGMPSVVGCVDGI